MTEMVAELFSKLLVPFLHFFIMYNTCAFRRFASASSRSSPKMPCRMSPTCDTTEVLVLLLLCEDSKASAALRFIGLAVDEDDGERDEERGGEPGMEPSPRQLIAYFSGSVAVPSSGLLASQSTSRLVGQFLH